MVPVADSYLVDEGGLSGSQPLSRLGSATEAMREHQTKRTREGEKGRSGLLLSHSLRTWWGQQPQLEVREMSAWLSPPFPSVQTARGTGDSVAHGRVVFTSVNPGHLELSPRGPRACQTDSVSHHHYYPHSPDWLGTAGGQHLSRGWMITSQERLPGLVTLAQSQETTPGP